MGLFNRHTNKLKFTNFSEQHFKSGVKRILWKQELLLADGFFEHGPDPSGLGGLPQGLFGANQHTYIACTDWRVIFGYLANGNFSSYEYKNINPQIQKKHNQYLFTYSDPETIAINVALTAKNVSNLSPLETYRVSKQVADAIVHNASGLKPSQSEITQITFANKEFGESFLGEYAKAKSGRDSIPMEKCSTCDGTMFPLKESEQTSQPGNPICTICLRVREN